MRNIFRTFIDSLFGREKTAGASASAASSSVSNSGTIDFIAPSGDSMNVPAVFGCVDILSANVSNMDFLYRRKHDGVFEADDRSTLNYLLNVQPNEYMTCVDFWRLAVQHLLLKGNVYIVPKIDRYRMEISGLYLIDPYNVYHDTINDTYTVTHSYDGIDGKYDEGDILHVKNISLDGKTGISTLHYARICVETGLAADMESLRRYKNGGNVRGIVSNDGGGVQGFGDYQDEQLAKTAESLDERFRKGEKIVSVPGSVQFSPITLSSQDMQFLDGKNVNAEDICRFFHVPPEFLFLKTSTNYKSVGMQNSAFLVSALNPILRKFEKEFERKLISKKLARTKEDFYFEREGIYACDIESMAAYQEKTIATGQMTVNEWREKNNKRPVEGGDKVLVSANLKDINELGKDGTSKVPDTVEPAE